jgi:copper chaperone
LRASFLPGRVNLFAPAAASVIEVQLNDIEGETEMATIKIKGMTCHHCVMAVTKALSGIDGIRDVQVDLEKNEAVFTEDKPVDRALIREKVRKAGFEVAD